MAIPLAKVHLHRSTKAFPSHLDGSLFTSEISPSQPRTKNCVWVPPESCGALLVSFTYMTLRSSFCPIASRSNVGDGFKQVSSGRSRLKIHNKTERFFPFFYCRKWHVSRCSLSFRSYSEDISSDMLMSLWRWQWKWQRQRQEAAFCTRIRWRHCC